MSETHSTLARRYRRLLVAYPRQYRKDRDAEIVDTLLDQAPADRTRPTLRETGNLLCHGMRARLGRPGSRTVVAWAALAAVLCGLFSAAAATRLAWETARPVPGRTEAAAILDTALPGRQLGRHIGQPDENQFIVYGEPLRWSHAEELLFGDGGEYQQNRVGDTIDGPTPANYRREIADAGDRLRAAGWDVSAPHQQNAAGCAGPPCDPATLPQDILITARRGDTVVEISVTSESEADTTYLTVELYRAAPWAVWPAGIAAGLIGGLIGWLVFGWASRRTDGRHLLLRALAGTLYGIAIFLWGLPTALGVAFSAVHHVSEPHAAWHPMWEWLGQPVFSLLFLVGCGSALLGLAIAAVPRRRAYPATTTATDRP
ncbi:MAG: hypothetical protein ACRDT4_23620 [Micromonosporaceae bacterium]